MTGTWSAPKQRRRTFLHTMAELGDRLGPLLLQLPPSFDVEGMGVLEDFLKRLPEGFRYAVEVRHRSWLGSDLPDAARPRRCPDTHRLSEDVPDGAGDGRLFLHSLARRQERIP